MELFESNKMLAMYCRVNFNGDEAFEVMGRQDRHTVYLSRQMCTCRAWDLTGSPCQHAICAMYHAKINPRTQISHYYHKDTYLASYRAKLQPVRGKQFWDTTTFLPMQPPPVTNLPGRPRKKRIRIEEAERRKKKSGYGADPILMPVTPPTNQSQPPHAEKLSKTGKHHKCGICNQEGHNRSTCKQVNHFT
ncbi:uncharacterized protein LOC114740405 [Neltuma alba]|uniref:uncharacterized protein LOC114740405 n=1 Tax=Neltuma alba TaxID=207710 RepID=UPI0010A4D46D|nr:uncharacterized protein LOC114740405 [Prosopis alba]